MCLINEPYILNHFGLNPPCLTSSFCLQGTEITDEDLVGEALWPSRLERLLDDHIPLRIPIKLVYLPTNLPLEISQMYVGKYTGSYGI